MNRDGERALRGTSEKNDDGQSYFFFRRGWGVFFFSSVFPFQVTLSFATLVT